jgi:Tellurite resistance protein TehB
MAQRPARSLKHEYELFVEQEIENYKESVPRSVLLSIGDEAVSALADEQQLALTELLLCDEVDRIIFKRLRLPSHDTWRRRRVKLLEELRRPEHWGLRPDDVLVRALQPTADGHVLVAGATDEFSALYLAANGCDVTTLSPEADALERVMQAAIGAGLSGRVHGQVGDLTSWTPGFPLNAVVVSPTALNGLSASERGRVIQLLQSATLDGGVHLLRAIASSGMGTGEWESGTVSMEELQTRYRDWEITVERSDGRSKIFLARKGAA